jgi:hypothetical protein
MDLNRMKCYDMQCDATLEQTNNERLEGDFHFEEIYIMNLIKSCIIIGVEISADKLTMDLTNCLRQVVSWVPQAVNLSIFLRRRPGSLNSKEG